MAVLLLIYFTPKLTTGDDRACGFLTRADQEISLTGNRTPEVAESCLGVEVSLHRLFYRELPAGTLDDLQLRNGFEEFEAVAKSTPLARESMDHNIAAGNRELQPDDLSDGYLLAQHS